MASQIDLISTLNLFCYAPFILEYHRVIYLSTGRLLQWMILKYVIHKMLKSSKTTLLCINSPSQPILMFKEGFLFIHSVCKLNPFETKSKWTSILNILYTLSIWEDGGSVERNWTINVTSFSAIYKRETNTMIKTCKYRCLWYFFQKTKHISCNILCLTYVLTWLQFWP